MGSTLSRIVKNTLDRTICTDQIGFGPLIRNQGYNISPCFINLFRSATGITIIIIMTLKFRFLMSYAVKSKTGKVYALKMFTSLAYFALALIFAIYILASGNAKNVHKYQLVSSWIEVAAAAVVFPPTSLLHIRTKVPSFTLSIYWIVVFLLNILYVASISTLGAGFSNTTIPTTILSLQSVLSLTALTLESFRKHHLKKYQQDELTPDYNQNIFQRLFLTTIPRLAMIALKRDVTHNDVNPIHKSFKVGYLSEDLKEELNKRDLTKNYAIFFAILSTYKYQIIYSAILKLLQDLMVFTSPILINLLSRHFKEFNDSADPDTLHQARIDGIIITLCMVAVAFAKTFFLHQYFYITIIIGMKSSSAMSYIIYKKSLSMSPESRTKIDNGKIINLMSSDCKKFIDFFTYAHLVWSAPLQIALGVLGLYFQLGTSVLIGLAPMIIIFGSNIYAAIIYKKFTYKMSACDDIRVKYVSEALRCIKVIKLQGWEKSIIKKIVHLRKVCLRILRLMLFVRGVQEFTWRSATILMSLVSFLVYSRIGDGPITTPLVVTSISLFNILQYPLTMLPIVISSYLHISVVSKRIRSLMEMKDETHDYAAFLPKTEATTGKSLPPLVKIENGSLSYSCDGANLPVLKNINVEITGPSLSLIIGRVGSGKSSLLLSLIGQLKTTSGLITLRGKTCYVPQIAWIMSDTLRNNIILGLDYDSNKYNAVIEAACLTQDINSFPDGDQTLIGERGFNLSGGQKQRVSLARALYTDSDIYLLDDVLSAVDPKSARHILEKAIGNGGLLRDKIRILSTLSSYPLREADRIYMMDNGGISTVGTHEELIHDERTSDFIKSMEEAEELIKDKAGKRQIKEDAKDITTISTVYDRRVSVRKSMMNESSGKKTALSKKYVENTQSGSVKMSTYMFYLKACKYKNAFLFLFFAILFQIVDVLNNYYITWWSSANDSAIAIGEDVPDPIWYIITISLIGVSGVVCVLIYTIIGAIACSLRASTVIHTKLIEAVMNFKLLFFDIVPDGTILNRFTSDISSVDFSIEQQSATAINMSLFILTTIIVNSIQLKYIFFMFALFCVIFMGCLKLYLSLSRQIRRLVSVSRSNVFSIFSQSLEGYIIIKNYDRVELFQKMALSNFDHMQTMEFCEITARRCLAISLEVVENLIIFSCGLFASLSMGHVTNQMLSLVLIYSERLSQRLSWLVRTICMLEMELVSVERIKEYVENPGESEGKNEKLPPPLNWPYSGKIEFIDYSARYSKDDKFVLRNINLVINPGERVGIVGRTGAGKSSLALSLFRVLESHTGSILIDDVNIDRISLTDLRAKLTMVPQDPILFIGTIRSNLDPFEMHTDEECRQALLSAGASDLVTNLKDGLNYEVTKNGENLSVGERQLICIARSIMVKSKIVIMDESTASIDKEKDALIQKALTKSFEGSTLLVIAHRLETILNSDKILLMDNGSILEYEHPDVLLHKDGGKFREMIEAALEDEQNV